MPRRHVFVGEERRGVFPFSGTANNDGFDLVGRCEAAGKNPGT
jgi:hypothetical protein